jgi:hypothetical protein
LRPFRKILTWRSTPGPFFSIGLSMCRELSGDLAPSAGSEYGGAE